MLKDDQRSTWRGTIRSILEQIRGGTVKGRLRFHMDPCVENSSVIGKPTSEDRSENRLNLMKNKQGLKHGNYRVKGHVRAHLYAGRQAAFSLLRLHHCRIGKPIAERTKEKPLVGTMSQR